MARQLLSAGVNVARDSHYVLNPVSGLYERSLLLEGAATNVCLQSENFGTTWVAIGTPTRTAGAIAAGVMGVVLDLIGDDDAGVAEGYSQTITLTGDGTKGLSIFMKRGVTPGPGGSDFVLRDTTASVDRFVGNVTWSAGGVPTVAMTTGTHLGTPIAYTNGIYRFRFTGPGIVAANVNSLQVYPCRRGTVADTGDVYAGGEQAENTLVPTSYIKTTTGVATRVLDALSVPFTPPPQEMTFYPKFIEQGTAQLSASAGRVFHIGAGGARLTAYGAGANKYRVDHNNGTATVTATHSIAVAYGDLVELRIVLGANGSLTLGQSVNGAAEVVTATTAANALTSAWSATTLWLNSFGAGSNGVIAFLDPNRAVLVLRGTQSLATCRAA